MNKLQLLTCLCNNEVIKKFRGKNWKIDREIWCTLSFLQGVQLCLGNSESNLTSGKVTGTEYDMATEFRSAYLSVEILINAAFLSCSEKSHLLIMELNPFL